MLSDAQMLQMQNQQHICSLLQSRLERVSPLDTPLWLQSLSPGHFTWPHHTSQHSLHQCIVSVRPESLVHKAHCITVL